MRCRSGAQANVERFVDMKTERIFSLWVGAQVVVGCANGVVRVFDPVTLQYVATLPRPHALGKENGPHVPSQGPPGAKDTYPDAIAVRGMWDAQAVVCVYSDHSLYVWDITAPKQPTKMRSFLSHTGCIWDLDVVPSSGAPHGLPAGTLVTCGADGTVRAWNVEEENLRASATSLPHRRSVYCRELLALTHTRSSLEHLTAQSLAREGGCPEGTGLRCVKVSPCGSQITSGDRDGTLRVHEWREQALRCT
jgi:WD40 repeat protein